MKLFVVFAAVILAAGASSDEELWMKFKQDHGKTYKSLREEKLRFGIFKNTLKEIKEHNARYEKGKETWYMGTNQFSDLTNEEFKALYLSYKPVEHESLVVMTFNVTVPNSIDWRSKGAVLSVKNQGQCGSCWAFSAVGAIEGQNAIKHNAQIDLSPQELVDCSTSYENAGCNGGLMTNAYAYVTDHGLSTLADYPYRATDGACKSQKNSAHLNVTEFRKVAPYEDQLKQAVGSVGPISVSIDAETIRNYKGGIYDNIYCGERLTHGVLTVGYGAEGNHEFWIVKNSWGTNWGEHGYIRITRNKYDQCGIAWDASFPVLA